MLLHTTQLVASIRTKPEAIRRKFIVQPTGFGAHFPSTKHYLTDKLFLKKIL